jgi:rhodanese-related sulfurtransferase
MTYMTPRKPLAGVLSKVLVAAAVLFALGSCGPAPETGTAISAAELADRIEAGTAPLILDVRTPAEFEAGRIPGAVNIPHDRLAQRVFELGISPSDEVVVHCQSGRRAGLAEAALREAGYTNVRDLSGHMQAWRDAGLPLQ